MLCGSAVWRLPTQDELLSIVKTTEFPRIDNAWFPNTAPWFYWTPLSYAGFPSVAWGVEFQNGLAEKGYRDYYDSYDGLVRLVR